MYSDAHFDTISTPTSITTFDIKSSIDDEINIEDIEHIEDIEDIEHIEDILYILDIWEILYISLYISTHLNFFIFYSFTHLLLFYK